MEPSLLSGKVYMKRHHITILIVSLCVIVMAIAYFIVLYRLAYHPSASLTQEKSLTIEYTNQVIDLDVNSEIWNTTKSTQVHLFPQSARVAYGQEEKDLQVKGLFNNEEIAFLLEFDDTSEDLGGLKNPDACAILLSPEDIPATAQMMGYESKVNIWQWSADRNKQRYVKGDQSIIVIRELVAEGPTTQKPLAHQFVIGKGEYQHTGWRVLFKRKLATSQPDEFEILPGTGMNIAFALWNGENLETFSRKSISILRPLIINKK